MIFPHNEWYIGNVLVCVHFSSQLAQNYAVIQTFRDILDFSHVNA